MFYNDLKEKIVYVGQARNNSFLEVHLAGVTFPNPEYSIVRSACRMHVFEYVVSGKGYIVKKDKRYEVGPGDFYYLGADESAYYYSDKNDPYEKLWVNVSGGLIDSLALAFGFTAVTIRHINVRQNFLEIHDILEHVNSENYSQKMRDVSRCFFNLMMDVQSGAIFPVSAPDSGLAEQIRAFIDDNLYTDIDLDDAMEVFHITKVHIIRVFKNAFGITPMQYMIKKRTEVAGSLLDNTVMPIKEISALLRYSNTQHFSNSFKKCTGLSPNERRKLSQAAEK